MRHPASGIRIIEVADFTFIPAASAILADWGADVIKVEHAERGDAMRGILNTGLMNLGAGGVHILFEHSNRRKRSIGLNLATPEGLDVLYRLVASCDVFITNKLPAVRKKLHIDVDDIRDQNPSTIYVSGSAYGSRGPDAEVGGYDTSAYWSRSGAALGVQADDSAVVPNQPGPAFGDSLAAMCLAGGVLAALLGRERTGEVTTVDASLLAVGVWSMGGAIGMSEQSGRPWRQVPRDASIRNPLVGNFRTSDGRWVHLSVLQGYQYWEEVCRLLGREDLISDPRFTSRDKWMENGNAGADEIASVIATRTLEEWKGLLTKFSGQWSPVNDTVDVLSDPQVIANGYVADVRTAEGAPFKLAAAPVAFDGSVTKPGRAPDFNEHGDAILATELGMDWQEIIDLKIKGVVA